MHFVVTDAPEPGRTKINRAVTGAVQETVCACGAHTLVMIAIGEIAVLCRKTRQYPSYRGSVIRKFTTAAILCVSTENGIRNTVAGNR